MPILTAFERIGTDIDGKYRVEAVIGQGGMGVVFAAVHLWTGRKVAIKLLRPELLAFAQHGDERLVHEARTTTRLHHPNIVQVLDLGWTEDRLPYLVMERLEGHTLSVILAARGRLAPSEALALLMPLMGAMAMAHDLGIVHRDLKPANVFVSRTPAGTELPKLLDFGIAKLMHETGMTASGVVLGTPQYLSPEQARGDERLGASSDVWAFGVMLYECLTGHLPIEARDGASLLARVVHGPPIRLDVHLPALDVRFAAAVERALQRDVSVRYPSLRSFAHALLLTAHAAGIALPTAPDPLGLPDWPSWLLDAGGALHTTAPTPVAQPFGVGSELRDEPLNAIFTRADSSHAGRLGSDARRRMFRNLALVAAASIGAALLAGALWSGRERTAGQGRAPVVTVAPRDRAANAASAAPALEVQRSEAPDAAAFRAQPPLDARRRDKGKPTRLRAAEAPASAPPRTADQMVHSW